MDTQALEAFICSATGAQSAIARETLQQLWSGYGAIERYALSGSEIGSVILKRICPPAQGSHPRGWNTDRSHLRKLRSYEVETEWYRNWAGQCTKACRVPHCYAVSQEAGEVWLLLEDLDAAGFRRRHQSVSIEQLRICLSWLAHFHARFLGVAPAGLWTTGTYWHLETRPDELIVLREEDNKLHAAAEAVDRMLRETRFQTLVHGDAKLANFCFSDDSNAVAAVDFQYVGGGCGMKDVAYFIGSCLSEADCDRLEAPLLDQYFETLRSALPTSVDFVALETEWRPLYRVAWTDFHRFLKGWSPRHWKVHNYSERISQEVVRNIEVDTR